MLYQSHRGDLYHAPENTMPAFVKAIEGKIFASIETDPRLTKDKKIVLIHDKTINRTCRNADGTIIESPVIPEECTYDELMAYDAGIAFGDEFKGTKIPLLEELLSYMEGKGVTLALDKAIKTPDLDYLFDVVSRFDVPVSFSVADTERIEKILSRFPDAIICYDGPSTDEMLQEVTKLVKPENLKIWLYLDKPNFNWLESTRKVSKETMDCAKRYAKVGIGNVNNTYDAIEAMGFLPDILEI